MQEYSEKIKIQFLIEAKEVIRYMSLNPNEEPIIDSILRTYSGIYDSKTLINLSALSKKSNFSEAEIFSFLEKLASLNIIEFSKKNNDATILFNESREDELTINRVSKHLESQNKLKTERFEAVLNYISEKKECKSNVILQYFDEKPSEKCGICSNCIAKNKETSNTEMKAVKIINLLKTTEMNSREIQKMLQLNETQVILTLQTLLENNTIGLKENNKYYLKNH